MSRLKRVKVDEQKAVVQKTIRLPVSLYEEFEQVMADAGIDKFNYAIEKLVEFEVEEWKKEQAKAKRKSASKKSSKNESGKESKEKSKKE